MNVTITQVAASPLDRFAPTAFKDQVGRTVPIHSTTAKLLDARVASDGRSVELDMDIDMSVAEQVSADLRKLRAILTASPSDMIGLAEQARSLAGDQYSLDVHTERPLF